MTYHEVNDHLPKEIVDPDQIEDVVNTINAMGIKVFETAPDTDSLLLSDTDVDEDAAEEAAAALAVDNEFGRTTDPVRMYMREMGTVDLLTREGEIKIAKRIEDGLKQVQLALIDFPLVAKTLIQRYMIALEQEEFKPSDLLIGFTDIPEDPNKKRSILSTHPLIKMKIMMKMRSILRQSIRRKSKNASINSQKSPTKLTRCKVKATKIILKF